MKVTVDQDRCQGHTLCAMIAPKVFQLDEIDGHSSPMSEDVPAGETEAAAEAMRSCPERAITITETGESGASAG
ncbi:ferredoxin [Streptomyces sp. NBC_01016]|uniref:ferredoxin n=1 Tax=Streptomyces sp. NBC_01016 TaxID=2903720 RepID=UPI00224F0F40|nr:ferredoxin [Streptomyces sp. NBC_01016]MCX4831288.1 ferredoxin [Streptomyces sp. NBC_01016]